MRLRRRIRASSVVLGCLSSLLWFTTWSIESQTDPLTGSYRKVLHLWSGGPSVTVFYRPSHTWVSDVGVDHHPSWRTHLITQHQGWFGVSRTNLCYFFADLDDLLAILGDRAVYDASATDEELRQIYATVRPYCVTDPLARITYYGSSIDWNGPAAWVLGPDEPAAELVLSNGDRIELLPPATPRSRSP